MGGSNTEMLVGTSCISQALSLSLSLSLSLTHSHTHTHTHARAHTHTHTHTHMHTHEHRAHTQLTFEQVPPLRQGESAHVVGTQAEGGGGQLVFCVQLEPHVPAVQTTLY